jgi:hypothetical protein
MTTLIGSASLCIAPLAFAQSDEGSPSVSETLNIPGPSSSMTDELLEPPTATTETLSGTPDHSADAPASDTYLEDVPEMNSDALYEDGQVLELPQAIDPALAVAPNSDDNSSTQVSNAGGDDVSAQARDESDGLNDYQSQNAEASEASDGYRVAVPVPIPIPVGPGFPYAGMGAPVQLAPRMGRVRPISPLYRGGGLRPTPSIILRSGGYAGVMSTSPMHSPLRGSAAIPRGWWTRTH